MWRETFGVAGDLGEVAANTEGLVIPEQPERTIVAVRIVGAGDEIVPNDTFLCKVMQGTRLSPIVLDKTAGYEVIPGDKDSPETVYEFKVHATVKGNFSVFINKPKNACKRIKYCDFWDNTAFMAESRNDLGESVVSYGKDELDIKKKIRKKVADGMRLEIEFLVSGVGVPLLFVSLR